MAFVLSYYYLCSFFPCRRILVPVLCGAEHCSTSVKSVFSSFAVGCVCFWPAVSCACVVWAVSAALVVESASAVAVYPSPALALQGVCRSSLCLFVAPVCSAHLGSFLRLSVTLDYCRTLSFCCSSPGVLPLAFVQAWV